MKNRINRMIANAKSNLNRACVRLRLGAQEAGEKLRETDGNFVMDHAVVFVLILVLGGIALLLLKNYLNNDLSSTLKDKINDFFN